MSEDAPTTTADNLSDELIASYRRHGFVRIPGAISRSEAAAFHGAALAFAKRQAARSLTKGGRAERIFSQHVNVWREDEAMRRLTLHPNLAAIATRLAGIPLRIWHDHILIKPPRKSAPTEFHQDRPYWPHATSRHSLSAWVALCDVPVERGCMTFIPGSHARADLRPQDLADAHDLLSLWPELAWGPRVTLPLRAGDCTFHHSLCAHMAGANTTGDPRVAHVVIYMDAETTYSGKRHIVTDPLGLADGDRLDGELFPAVPGS